MDKICKKLQSAIKTILNFKHMISECCQVLYDNISEDKVWSGTDQQKLEVNTMPKYM